MARTIIVALILLTFVGCSAPASAPSVPQQNTVAVPQTVIVPQTVVVIQEVDGYEYNAGIGATQPALQSGNLATGDKARGSIAAEIRESATNLVLTYLPLDADDYQPLRVVLE